MAIFGQYQGGDAFNVSGNMDAVLKQQQATHQSMLDAVAKYNGAREEMATLQATTGSVLSQYGVDEKGKPADDAPKYVHDLYKAVNKEGGVANMSKSQMMAGLQAFQTGQGLEGQQQQREAQRLNMESAKQTNAINAFKLAEMKKSIEERDRIEAAKKATAAAVKGITKTKTVKEEKTEMVLSEGRTIKISTEEAKPLIAKINSADSTPEEKLQARKDLEALAYKSDPDNAPIAEGDTSEGDPNPQFSANPNMRPLVSAYSKPKRLKDGEAFNPTFDVNALEGFISRESEKFKKSADNPENARLEKLRKAEEEIALEQIGSKTTTESSPIKGTYSVTKFNDPESERLFQEMTAAEGAAKTAQLQMQGKAGKPVKTAYNPMGLGQQFRASEFESVPLTAEERKQAQIVYRNAKVKAEQSKAKLEARQESLISKVKETQTALTPYSASEIKVRAANADQFGYVPEKTTVEKQVERTLAEQTDDEYAIMSAYLDANGGKPATFTKESFYRSKGILAPQVYNLTGTGHSMVTLPDGETKIIENKGQASQMSIRDQKTIDDARKFAEVRNMSGVTMNGFSFSGEVRVGDIDQAQKVKIGIGHSTKAVENVERLIEIAENEGLYSKLVPAQISGIATALTNSAQAANRTEIGGSGAWSNQDQEYMNKVVRDPTMFMNAIFREQTIASLKEYKARLEGGLIDSGKVYGFSYERTSKDGVDGKMDRARMTYNTLRARGYSVEEAEAESRKVYESNSY
jgi:hypothetical protein